MHSNDTRRKRLRNERKRRKKIADASRRGEKGTASVIYVVLVQVVFLKNSDLCLDLHLAGLHSFVDGGVLPAQLDQQEHQLLVGPAEEFTGGNANQSVGSLLVRQLAPTVCSLVALSRHAIFRQGLAGKETKTLALSPRGEQFGVRGKKPWQKTGNVDSAHFEDRALKTILKSSRVVHSFSASAEIDVFPNHCVLHDRSFQP